MTRAYELLTVASAIAAIETLQARVAELEDKYQVQAFTLQLAEKGRDALAAELAAIKNQEPVGVVGTTTAVWTASTHDCKWNPPGEPLKTAHLFKDVPLGAPLFAKPTPPVQQEPVAWRWRMNGQWHYGPEPLFKDGFTTQEPLYDKPIPPVREPLSYRDILRIYNEVGPEDGVPYRFAGAIEAITKEQK